jgi:hypothetical protein
MIAPIGGRRRRLLYRQSEACCGSAVLNFLASAVNAERWLAEHREVRGDVTSMPEAAAVGRAVFGDVLTES